MSRHATKTSFEKGQAPWNKRYQTRKEWYKANYIANREKILKRTRASSIEKKFGIPAEEYYAKRKEQGDLCGACGRPLDESPALDHDHETGELREFCHRTCNAAMGSFNDDPELLRRAADYLEKYRARQ